MKHTPGPWKSITHGNTIDILDEAATHYGLACIRPFGNRDKGIPTGEDKANARLIAACPEMYEAISALLNSTDYCDDERPLMNALRAAKRKAEEGL